MILHCTLYGEIRNRRHDPNTWPVCQNSRPGLPQEAVKRQMMSLGGTNNLKYNLGDRHVFWWIQSRQIHQSISERQELMVLDNVILHPGPLFRVNVPIPSILGISMLLKTHRCAPQREPPSTTGSCPAQEYIAPTAAKGQLTSNSCLT